MFRDCPICGRAFSALDMILAENDVRFQCPHCWNRVRATGPVGAPGEPAKRTKVLPRRRSTLTARRKK